ncbi:MAG TPA: PilN domain-containing protein [Pararobbsia sp.]|nr:PilN domain-containing protein [Pararobbsia sp.]
MGAIVIAGLLIYVSKLTVQSWIADQQGRNAILKNEIAELDKQITAIRGLESQRERLLARMEVIDQLQRSRPEVVHLFDEIAKAIPEGVYLTEVTQQNNRIELRGAAQSSTRVSALMRNIDSSEYLSDPGLDVVETVTTGPERASQFKMFAQQVPMAEKDTAAQEQPR